MAGASFKNYKANIAEVEERKAKSLANAENIARRGKMDFLEREKQA